MALTQGERLARLRMPLEARRRYMPLRVVLGLGLTWAAWVLTASPAVAVWYAVYVAVQGLEAFSGPRLLKAAAGRARAARYAILAQFFCNGAVVVTLAAIVWPAAPYGQAMAACLVAGSLMNLVVLSGGRMDAFQASALPYAAAALLIPLLDQDVSLVMRGVVAMGAIMALVNVMSLAEAAATLVADRNAAYAAAEKGRQAAEAAVAAKSTLIASISHDLRTPLSAITAAAESLEAGGRSLKGRVGMIREGAAMMGSLLNELLDLSKLEAGRMVVTPAPVALRSLLAESIGLWRAQARVKGLTLRVAGAKDCPDYVQVDAVRLRQILNNLLSNAIKYVDAGGVTLSLAADRTGDAWTLRLCVTDTGPGFTDDQRQRLFAPFEQFQMTRLGSSGLGLNVSRELARLMGGDLRLLPTREGACFELTLRLAEAQRPPAPVAAPALAPALADEAEPEEDAAGRALRILAVDDHILNRRALQMLLEPLGWRVTGAASGVEALERLQVEAFDLVLTDLNMPGMDGLELASRLRRSVGPNRNTPMLAVTGAEGVELEEACRAAGIRGLVGKPLVLEALLGAIMEAVQAPAAAVPAISQAA